MTEWDLISLFIHNLACANDLKHNGTLEKWKSVSKPRNKKKGKKNAINMVPYLPSDRAYLHNVAMSSHIMETMHGVSHFTWREIGGKRLYIHIYSSFVIF